MVKLSKFKIKTINLITFESSTKHIKIKSIRICRNKSQKGAKKFQTLGTF